MDWTSTAQGNATLNCFETPLAQCQFGVHRCDITLPENIYHHMWGAATHDQAEGIHQPLTATAVVLQSHGTDSLPLVLVALDHCILLAPEMSALTERICNDHQLTPDQLVINFSHTHAAGLLDPDFSEQPGGELILPYLERMYSKISAAVEKAYQNTSTANLTYGTGHCSLATNRDFWDEKHKIFVCGFNPTGSADKTVLVIRVSNPQGEPIATLVNYACHPTSLAWDNRLISPDYPGMMRTVVEKETGVPCIFLQGASGDVGPQRGYSGDTQVAEKNGRQLGFAVLETWESLPPPATQMLYAGPVVSGATLGTWEDVPLTKTELDGKSHWSSWHKTLELPYLPSLPTLDSLARDVKKWQELRRAALEQGRDLEARDAHAELERSRRWLSRLSTLPTGDCYPYQIHLWRIGDGVWIALQGEPYNVLQTTLRERFPETPLIVSTLSAGSFPVYLPARDTYGQGIYQESIALLDAGCLETVIDAVGDGIGELMSQST